MRLHLIVFFGKLFVLDSFAQLPWHLFQAGQCVEYDDDFRALVASHGCNTRDSNL